MHHFLGRMKIGITIGDPAGIGPEMVLRAVPELGDRRKYLIFGNKRILERTAHDLRLVSSYKAIQSSIIDATEDVTVNYGRPTRKTASVALHSMQAALESGVKIIVTAPIVKEAMRKMIPDFIGHTEYFAEFFGARDYAMTGLWRDKRIMLLTTHIPLRKVFKKVDAGVISERIAFFKWGLERYFNIDKPRIAVSAINPHAYEFSLGEDEEIRRAVMSAKKRGIEVSGPFPADTLFTRRYDGFIAVYHDQAMVFLKSKRNGLNFTLGLPIIRLSPLCGAALDIAGKCSADVLGFVSALRTGPRLYKNMMKYDENK
jgi:4-hydroxy-L-threonine phosphate dehydrogenase PdxA